MILVFGLLQLVFQGIVKNWMLISKVDGIKIDYINKIQEMQILGNLFSFHQLASICELLIFFLLDLSNGNN